MFRCPNRRAAVLLPGPVLCPAGQGAADAEGALEERFLVRRLDTKTLANAVSTIA